MFLSVSSPLYSKLCGVPVAKIPSVSVAKTPSTHHYWSFLWWIKIYEALVSRKARTVLTHDPEPRWVWQVGGTSVCSVQIPDYHLGIGHHSSHQGTRTASSTICSILSKRLVRSLCSHFLCYWICNYNSIKWERREHPLPTLVTDFPMSQVRPAPTGECTPFLGSSSREIHMPQNKQCSLCLLLNCTKSLQNFHRI